jgi:hypothetical protein
MQVAEVIFFAIPFLLVAFNPNKFHGEGEL